MHQLVGDEMPRATAWMRRKYGQVPIETALTSAMATPFVALLDALAADYGLAEDDPSVAKLGEATLALYFYVRIQDDVVDEPDVVDPAHVYVAEIFNGASQRAFAEALADGVGPFLAFRERTMAAFARAAMWEVDTFRNGSVEPDLRRMGEKFLPMAVCLGAMALRAGRAEHLDPLVEFVTTFGGGLQMVNDVLNVKEDHALGRLTPVLRWLYAGGRLAPDDPAGRVRPAMLADGSMPRALAVAKDAMSEAERQADAIGPGRLAAVPRDWSSRIDGVPDRLFGLLLGLPAQ